MCPQLERERLADPLYASMDVASTDKVNRSAGVGKVVFELTPLERQWLYGYTCVLHLDYDSLQYCIVRHTWRGRTIVDLAKIYIPQDFRSPDRWADFLGPEILALTARKEFAGARFVLSVGGSNTAFRSLRLPDMPRRELDRAVYFEGAKKTPFPIDESYYGYVPRERVTSGGTRELNLSFVAASRHYIDELVHFFGNYGITFQSIVQDATAMGALLANFKEFDRTQFFGLIHIKSRGTEIAFYSGSCLRYLQKINLGTESLQRATPYAPEPAAFLARAQEKFSEQLIQEVQNSLDFYSAQGGTGAIDSINSVFVHGDLAYCDEVIHRLNGRFDIDFQRFPFSALSNIPCVRPELCEVIPTTLQSLAVAISRRALPDLTPPKTRRLAENKRLLKSAVGVACGVALFWGTLIALSYQQMSVTRDDVLATQMTLVGLKATPAYATLNQIQAQIAGQSQIIFPKNRRARYASLFRELSVLTPAGITLDRFDYDRTTTPTHCEIEGAVRGNIAPLEATLASFISRLEQSPLFSDVTLKSEEKKTEGFNQTLFFSCELVVKVDAP